MKNSKNKCQVFVVRSLREDFHSLHFCQLSKLCGVASLNDAHVMRKSILKPGVEALDEIDVVAKLHEAIVAQQVPLWFDRFA